MTIGAGSIGVIVAAPFAGAMVRERSVDIEAKPAMLARPVKIVKTKIVRKTAGKANLAAVKDQVLAYVKAHANERSEKIRAVLKLERPVYLRAVGELVAEKKIAKKGEKRKTSFSAVG